MGAGRAAGDGSGPRFAVTTFERVFDVEPTRDVVSLAMLSDALQSFMVKPETRAKVERAERLIEAAWESFTRGEHRSGKAWSRLSKAARDAEAAGEDPGDAAARERRQMLSEARSDPKRDLRLWSPAHYPPDARRGGENVVHLSCLVLDYDGGTSVERASGAWEEYFHVVHTTWSHTAEHPKLRLVLPLAEPVRPVDWRRVYEWAQARADDLVDPTGKSVGTTFALPAVADEALPRIAFAHQGPLLDARLEGLIEEAAPPPPADVEPDAPNHFRIPIPGHRTVTGSLDVSFDAGPGSATSRASAEMPSPTTLPASPARPSASPATPSSSGSDQPGDSSADDPWDDATFPWE